jgi:hypothetical protein
MLMSATAPASSLIVMLRSPFSLYGGQYADRPVADACGLLHPDGASARNCGIRIRYGRRMLRR